MIPAREVLDLRTEWSIDPGVIEKDYLLGWLLAAIANEPQLAKTWIFKGGTCLRKCYYETYRLSELCRHRHNSDYSARRVMPHGCQERCASHDSGIIRAA